MSAQEIQARRGIRPSQHRLQRGAAIAAAYEGTGIARPAALGVLCLALAFPVTYFFYDLRRRGRRNIISIIGL
jgi:hypothetical protein